VRTSKRGPRRTRTHRSELARQFDDGLRPPPPSDQSQKNTLPGASEFVRSVMN